MAFWSWKKPPPSPKLLDRNWRKIPPWEKDQYLQYIYDYEPHKKDVEHLRILLHGPIGSGKSSFINSVETALRDRMTGQALTAEGMDSFTIKHKTLKIQKKQPGTFYPFVFNDTMGIEGMLNRGICVDDLKLLMKGHVRDGYMFHPHTPLTKADPAYISRPTINDRTHVLVCIIPATTVSLMHESIVDKMREVRLAARDLGIPQMALLTKIDDACPEVDSDLRNVHRSKFIKEQMERLSKSLGIPLTCIFPVKNYHEEICKDDEIEKLVLMAMKQMIDFGEDFVNNLNETDEPSESDQPEHEDADSAAD